MAHRSLRDFIASGRITAFAIVAMAGQMSAAQALSPADVAVGERVSASRSVPRPPSWAPTLAIVAASEAKLRLPPTSLKLGAYVRYYTGEIVGGRRMLRGYFVLSSFMEGAAAPDGPGVHIKAPPLAVMDGGCGVITVEYDVEAGKFASVSCNGLA